MRRTTTLAALALAAATTFTALPGGASAATTPSRTFNVVSGEVRLRGDEQVCFTLTDDDFASDRLLVRVRFTGSVPRGYLTLDGARSDDFSRTSEEVPFTVDPRGVHRLAIAIPAGATVDQLSITSSTTTIVRESCTGYDFDRERRVNLETSEPPTTNVFETPEERAERERQQGVPRATSPTGPTGPTGPSAPATAPRPGVTVPGSRIPSGTEMSLTLQGPIDTRTAYAGQLFTTYLDSDLLLDGRLVLPAGTRIEGHVVESKDAGRFGRSSLTLGFDKAYLDDGRVATLQASVQRLGKGSAAKQGGIIAGSAIGGAILGAVLGGDTKDAVLGAIVGGAIAAGTIGAKEGESIVLPAGTVMTVRTETEVSVPEPAAATAPARTSYGR